MIITRQFLESKNACKEGKEWFISAGIFDLVKGVQNLLANGHFSWANWLLSRVFTHRQQILYAIYCAELVLKIFERKYPKDLRPRKAIQAAKNFVKSPTEKNRQVAYAAANAAYTAYAANAAADAAANAANAAADAAYTAYAANAAADAAANAADAAANAANAAANAAYTANAANAAADAAAAAADAWTKICIKIIAFGIKLFIKGEK